MAALENRVGELEKEVAVCKNEFSHINKNIEELKKDLKTSSEKSSDTLSGISDSILLLSKSTEDIASGLKEKKIEDEKRDKKIEELSKRRLMFFLVIFVGAIGVGVQGISLLRTLI